MILEFDGERLLCPCALVASEGSYATKLLIKGLDAFCMTYTDRQTAELKI